jgi:hypothetical protein
MHCNRKSINNYSLEYYLTESTLTKSSLKHFFTQDIMMVVISQICNKNIIDYDC